MRCIIKYWQNMEILWLRAWFLLLFTSAFRFKKFKRWSPKNQKEIPCWHQHRQIRFNQWNYLLARFHLLHGWWGTITRDLVYIIFFKIRVQKKRTKIWWIDNWFGDGFHKWWVSSVLFGQCGLAALACQVCVFYLFLI